MTVEEMRQVLTDKGYNATTKKPGVFYLPVLAVETHDPQPIVEDVTDYFQFCPEWEWRLIGGKGYLLFTQLQVYGG